jgi:hypothetical protein
VEKEFFHVVGVTAEGGPEGAEPLWKSALQIWVRGRRPESLLLRSACKNSKERSFAAEIISCLLFCFRLIFYGTKLHIYVSMVYRKLIVESIYTV